MNKIISVSIKRKILTASAPGGYSLYWAIMFGVLVMSAYLVGGLIPTRFPEPKEPPEAVEEDETASESDKDVKGAATTARSTVSQIIGCKPGIIFLIDSSKAMGGRKLENIKAALLSYGTVVSDDSVVGVVTFTNSVETAVEPGRMQVKRGEYQYAVSTLSAEGEGDLGGGFSAVKDRVTSIQTRYPNYRYSVIVLSDGSHLTTSVRELFRVHAVSRELTNMGVRIDTIDISDAVESGQTQLLVQAASSPAQYHFVSESGKNLSQVLQGVGSTLCAAPVRVRR
jgi:uncharacterized protein YegL